MAVLLEIKVPLVAVNDTSLTVVEMSCENGQAVRKGDLLLVFETSKTTYEVQSTESGFVEYLCEVGNDYEVNELVAKIHDNAEAIQGKPTSVIFSNEKKQKATVNIDLSDWSGETVFSAGAAALMKKRGLEPSVFAGRDFVSTADVEEMLNGGNGSTTKKRIDEPKSPTRKKEIPVDQTKVIVEKLSFQKKREIEYLAEVQSAGLTSTLYTTVETEGIFTFINPSLKYLKNSLLPVIVYEASRLLQKFPLLNAYFTGDGIAKYKDVQVGFAIDIDKGLKVLRIPNTSQLAISAVEDAIMELSNRYLDDTLQIEDLTDISFTITDLSAEGVSFFKPLINMLNSAILGVSSIDEKLNRCTFSVTFDHRVTEGKTVAQFLHELKQRIESYQSRNYASLMQDISCSKCGKVLKEDLGDIGFVKCITPQGREGYLCQACLQGF